MTFSSAREKPRPARTRRLYLMEGQRTMGLSLSTGRGARAAALVRRALRRRDLRPGCGLCVSDWLRACGWCVWRLGMGRSWLGGDVYLVEMGADTTLPILAEV